MTHFAPRQGFFAVILLLSLCAHILLLVFSSEKAQQEDRFNKGNQIVNQLTQEATLALASQDRVSLSVITNRYQTDSEVAKLAISDADSNILVQTGQAQTQSGQVIDKTISQDNKLLGHLTVTMKDVSKGEIISRLWTFVLGSVIVHGFLLLLYSYVARPTKAQFQQIGEKVQQRMVISRGGLPQHIVMPKQNPADADNQNTAKTENTAGNSKKIVTQYLHANKHPTADTSNAPVGTEEAVQADMAAFENPDFIPAPTYPQESVIELVALKEPEVAVLQIRFFDEYNLFEKLAPEVALPYLDLCNELLRQSCQAIISDNPPLISRQINRVAVHKIEAFTAQGAFVEIKGEKSQIAMLSVLLGKLFIILNQVVYEKHRELGRFALPARVGVSLDAQTTEMLRLLNLHSRSDSVLMLFTSDMLKTLDTQIQLKNSRHPTTLAERQMVWYDGMAEYLIKNLIEKRNMILTASLSDHA